MKFKKLLALLIVLAVLIGAVLAKKTAQDKKEKSGRTAIASVEAPLEAGFAPAFISRIELERAGWPEKLELVKGADQMWSLKSHADAPARSESVEAFLKKLSGLRGEVRASDEAVLKDFGLDEERAIHIRLKDAQDTEVAHLLLSAQRPRGTQNFMRLASSSDVVVTGADVLADLAIFSKEDTLKSDTFIKPKG